MGGFKPGINTFYRRNTKNFEKSLILYTCQISEFENLSKIVILKMLIYS